MSCLSESRKRLIDLAQAVNTGLREPHRPTHLRRPSVMRCSAQPRGCQALAFRLCHANTVRTKMLTTLPNNVLSAYRHRWYARLHRHGCEHCIERAIPDSLLWPVTATLLRGRRQVPNNATSSIRPPPNLEMTQLFRGGDHLNSCADDVREPGPLPDVDIHEVVRGAGLH